MSASSNKRPRTGANRGESWPRASGEEAGAGDAGVGSGEREGEKYRGARSGGGGGGGGVMAVESLTSSSLGRLRPMDDTAEYDAVVETEGADLPLAKTTVDNEGDESGCCGTDSISAVDMVVMWVLELLVLAMLESFNGRDSSPESESASNLVR